MELSNVYQVKSTDTLTDNYFIELNNIPNNISEEFNRLKKSLTKLSLIWI
jgi:hypothetical protein